MKITSIKMTKTFGNYENISMEGVLEEGETVQDASDKLQNTIKSEIDRIQGINCAERSLKNDVNELIRQKTELEIVVQTLYDKKEAIEKWVETHGLKMQVLSDFQF